MAGNEQIERQRAAVEAARGNRSVLDSPLKRAGQWAFDLLYGSGEPNPADFANPLGGVTGYITKGVPDVARRQMQTSAIRDQIGALFAKHPMRDELLALVDRKPRVAAHVMGVNWPEHIAAQREVERDIGRKVQGVFWPDDYTPKMGSVLVDPKQSKDVLETLAHELTHAAQNVGIGDRLGGFGRVQGNTRIGKMSEDAIEYSAGIAGKRQAQLTRGVPRAQVGPAPPTLLPGLIRAETIHQLRKAKPDF